MKREVGHGPTGQGVVSQTTTTIVGDDESHGGVLV